jgi:hypothetical protein
MWRIALACQVAVGEAAADDFSHGRFESAGIVSGTLFG